MLRVAVCAIALSFSFYTPAEAGGSKRKKDNSQIKVDVDVDSYNKNYNRNNQSQGQMQGQQQGQSQTAKSNSNSNSNSTSKSNSSSQSNNQNEVNIEGDETFISYEEAAASAASVYASKCTVSASGQSKDIGGAFGRETQQCKYLRQAEAFFRMMVANVEIVLPHLNHQRSMMREDIIQWETELRDADDSFRQEVIKGASDKSDSQIVAEQRFLAKKRQINVRLLEMRYEQYEHIEFLRVEQYERYNDGLEGFYNSIDKANASITRLGVTGFFVEVATDIIMPVGIAKALFGF